jgi:hypothetical protein
MFHNAMYLYLYQGVKMKHVKVLHETIEDIEESVNEILEELGNNIDLNDIKYTAMQTTNFVSAMIIFQT